MMQEPPSAARMLWVRICAVTYLNARPLIVGLSERAPQMGVDPGPSRAGWPMRWPPVGWRSAALAPSIEHARGRDYAIAL